MRLCKCFTTKKNAFNTSVRAQGYAQCMLVSNHECKHNFCLFKRKLHRATLTAERFLNCINFLLQYLTVCFETISNDMISYIFYCCVSNPVILMTCAVHLRKWYSEVNRSNNLLYVFTLCKNVILKYLSVFERFDLRKHCLDIWHWILIWLNFLLSLLLVHLIPPEGAHN